MNYFVSENIFTFNSGTEHGQAKRTKLFNEHGQGAIYVTRNYNRFLHRDVAAVDLDMSQVLNMYDYFQGVTNVTRKEQALRLLDQIPLAEYHIVGHGPNYSTINHAGREMAKITVMPATVGLVNEIIYYDAAGNTTVRENFDWRGFKSSVDYFNPDGSLAVQQFLNLAGTPVLEIIHMDVNGTRYPTMWKLLNFQGRNIRFDSQDALFTFFLSDLANQNPGSNFISDRRSLDRVVADIAGTTNKYAYLHDIHTPDVAHPQRGKLYDAYRVVLEERAMDFKAIFTPTAEQARDLKLRFPKATFKAAPDTYVDNAILAQPLTGLTERVRHRIAYVGRLSPEKRPEDAIKVLAKVRTVVPDATLELIGYAANTEIRSNLDRLAQELGVTDQVIFTAYGDYGRVNAVLNTAQVLVQTSLGEGFGMNLVEAFAHGVPVVTYDINYGAKNLVTDGSDGYVVPSGSVNQMAQRVIALFNDEAMWLAASTAAYTKARQYNGDAMYTAWQAVL